MNYILLVCFFIAAFNFRCSATDNPPEDSEQEMALYVRSVAILEEAIRRRPDEVGQWSPGNIKPTKTYRDFLFEGRMARQDITMVEFLTPEAQSVRRCWKVSGDTFFPYDEGSIFSAGGYFLDAWPWYELPGDGVLIAKEASKLPVAGRDVLKLPKGWVGTFSQVLKNRNDHSAFFDKTPTKEQRLQLLGEIRDGPALWSLVLARRLAETDAAEWGTILDLVLNRRDPVLAGAFLVHRVESYTHENHPWNTIWGNRRDRLLLDISALACAAAAHGPSCERSMVESAVLLSEHRRPTMKELTGDGFRNCPPYQWAQQLADQIAQLEDKESETIQYGLCVSLLGKMRVMSMPPPK